MVAFAKKFGVNIKRKIKWAVNKSFQGKQPNTPFPIDATKGITVGEALTTFIDIQGPISKKLLKDILPHCRSLDDREKIERWTKLGDKTFDADVIKKHIGLRDLMSLLPSLKLKAEFILQKFPTIMPRYYTIASSSLAHPSDLAMAISLTSWKMEDGSPRQGLMSAFCDDLASSGKAVGSTVRAFVKSSVFKFPADPQTPIIMVGPGTGVVPFIGFM